MRMEYPTHCVICRERFFQDDLDEYTDICPKHARPIERGIEPDPLPAKTAAPLVSVSLGPANREWNRHAVEALKAGTFKPGMGYGVYPDRPYDKTCPGCGESYCFTGLCAKCYLKTPLRVYRTTDLF